MTATSFRLTLPMGELHNSNHRVHWAVKARKARAMREAAEVACRWAVSLAGPVELTVTFAFPDKRRRDLDNYSIKAAIDGAVDAGVIPDDRSTVLRAVTRRPAENVAPKGYVVLVFEFREVGQESQEAAV